MDLSIPVLGINRSGKDSRGNTFAPVEATFFPDGSSLEFEKLDGFHAIADLSPEVLEQRKLPFKVTQGW